MEGLQRLSPDVMQVILKLDGGERIAFYAGQYINILLDDGAKRSFSFATAPVVHDRIELHIRRIAGGRYTTHVFERMRPGDRVRFEGPLGSFFLREDSEKPMIFVAGSTGFAPVKSMLEYAFSRGVKRRCCSTGACGARPTCICASCRRNGRASTRTSASCR